VGVDEVLDAGFGGPQEGEWPDPADQLRKRERQQGLVAELGRSALTGTPLERLVEDAVAAAADGLGADRVGLLAPDGDGGTLVCRSSRGWPEEELRPVAVDADSQVAETFRRRDPIVVDDFASEKRFAGSRHLTELGLASGATAPIRGEEQPVGVLVAHSRRPRAFGMDDVVFLRAVANVIAVVTARERAEERRRQSEEGLTFLAEAGQILAETLDYDTTLANLAKLVVPRLADWFIVDLAEEDGTMRRVVVAAAQPEKQALLEELSRSYPPVPGSPQPAARAVERGTTVHFPDFTPESLRGTTRDERHFELMTQLDPRSAIAVPLVVRGRMLGALTFAWSESERRYADTDLALAEEIARRAAHAIDNAQLYRSAQAAQQRIGFVAEAAAPPAPAPNTSRLYREAEERAEAARALETIADGVFLVDEGGVIRVWNAAAETITGLPASGVRGRPAGEVLPEWDRIVQLVPVRPLGQRPPVPQTIPVAVSGRELWLSIAGVGSSEGAVYAFRDVTEERRLEQLKSDFVATVSHELRTPLAAVYGSALTLAGRDLSGRTEIRDQLVAQIADQAARLAAIVEDILLTSELDAGGLRVEPAEVDPLELARSAVEAARARAGDGARVELVAPERVGSINADGGRLRQVLDNLIENAIKYSPDGSRTEVRVEERERTVSFAVADEGSGIPPEEHERIFEKFYRLDPEQAHGVGGTGLGLYVCRELVERMDGRISVESAPGRGSTFRVELPR